MSDKCGAQHPELAVTCMLGYPHEEHTARAEGKLVHWPNESWVAQKDPRQLMKDLSFAAAKARMPAQTQKLTNGLARTSDPLTSHEAGRKLSSRDSQKAALLEHYIAAGEHGLTDDEAAVKAGLVEACFWRRCTDLRQDGLIGFNGTTRLGPLHNARRQVSVYRDHLRDK